jgi:hypothetical protein
MPRRLRRRWAYGPFYGHCCNPFHHFGFPPPWWGERPSPEEEQEELKEYIES